MLTQEQLKQRLSCITGSDAAVICGYSQYKSKVRLWQEKTGRVEQEDISDKNHIKFGNYMESGVADWFEAETGKPLCVVDNKMLIHPTLAWMSGNIDRRVLGENAILECKTAGSTDGWGEQGENIIPKQYLLQVAHYCAVGNFDRAYIAVVFNMTREFRWYTYERNTTLEEKLIAQEQEFWFNNVVADVAPEPKTAEDVLALFDGPNFDPVYGSAEDEALVISFKSLNETIKQYEEKLQSIKDQICVRMGNHETLLGPNGLPLATWKYTKGAMRFDAKAFEKERPELYKHYSKQSQPTRRFLPKIGDTK